MDEWTNVLVTLLAICGGITTVCVTGEHIIKMVKGIKQPAKDVHKMLDTDKKRLDDHDAQIVEIRDDLKYLINSNNILMRSMLTVLTELAKNNDKDGKIGESMEDINKFLTPVKE